MDDTELVVVRSFGSRIEAEVAQGALNAAGIESAVIADDVGGQYAALSLSAGGVRLQVRPEDLAAAEELLSQAT
jgi:hypothetical protein